MSGVDLEPEAVVSGQLRIGTGLALWQKEKKNGTFFFLLTLVFIKFSRVMVRIRVYHEVFAKRK
jgi:hypothetical protein